MQRPVWIPIALCGLLTGVARGQQGPVVQLPTFHSFRTGTTVSVPDRGRMSLGGIGRAASGRAGLAAPLLPWASRSSGSRRSAAGTSVSVYVHDFEAMDRQLLAEAAAKPSIVGSPPPRTQETRGPTPGVWQRRIDRAENSSAGRSAMSVAAAAAQNLRERQARSVEAGDLFRRGLQAERDGKANVARIFYRQAYRKASGPLKNEIRARLGSTGGVKLPPRRPSSP